MKRWSHFVGGGHGLLDGHAPSSIIFLIKVHECTCTAVGREKGWKLDILLFYVEGEAGLSIVLKRAAGQFVNI